MPPGQLCNESSHRLLHRRLLLRADLLSILDVRRLEGIAGTNVAVFCVGTILDRLRQSARVPAIQKVPVKAKPSGIAVAEYEPAPHWGVWGMYIINTVQDFVKNVDERHRVRGRAIPVIDAAQVRYVALVFFVEVHAVPAGLEMHLRSQPVCAARLCEMRCFFLDLGVEAGEADALGDFSAAFCHRGGEREVVEAPGVLVARQHTQPGRKGLYVGAVGAATEVVDGHTVGGDFLEGVVGVLIVKQRGPIGRFISLDFAGGAVGGLESDVGGIVGDV